MTRSAFFFASLLALSGCVSSRTTARRDVTCGTVRVPAAAELDGHRLALNGMAIREATILAVDVYVGALYVERVTRDVETLVTSAQHKRLELHFVRDIGRDDVIRFLRWGFRNNPEALRFEYESEADAIERYFTDYVAGDVVTFDYRPGSGITMSTNGALLGFWDGDVFAQVFLRVFVGPRSGNAPLRAGLVGGVCNE